MVTFFFFILLPPPPRSTLFPYTTLFRSEQVFQVLGRVGHAFLTVPEKRKNFAVVRLDRKSTRLNSSHVRTSYAVFCLKKKTKRESGIDFAPSARAIITRTLSCSST